MPASSLRTLLAHSVDYAGLFPPCNLGLEPALRNYAEYVRSAESWMLGTFVLPVAQFEAAISQLSRFNRDYPLRLSALGPKSDGRGDFREKLAETVKAIRSARSRNDRAVAIDQLEMPLPVEIGLPLFAEIEGVVIDLELPTFWEAPPDAAERVIALLAQHNARTGKRRFGYKLRSGGVTPEAFPTSVQIARALVASAKYQVPIKFTAGLHHPVRQFRDEVHTKMHGFLNVLGAAVLAAEHSWDEATTATMLEDENSASFSFSDQSFGWRKWKIEADGIALRRKTISSFGSCSFDEPREDLRELKLL